VLLARVKGNLVSSVKNQYLSGHKLLLVHPINLNGESLGENDFISIDLVDAGIGDTVLVVQEGDAVQQILVTDKAPINTQIIAIVDAVEIDNDSDRL
jgi:microcompartment protein CcmK/EutM